MTGTDEKKPGSEARHRESAVPATHRISFDALRARAQQLSLREQLERQHYLLQRLSAASARLIQAVEHGEVFEAIGEIIGNLIGSEEVAIFQYRSVDQVFFPVWSAGVKEETLRKFGQGAGLIGRAAHEGVSQFRDRQPGGPLQPFETNLTACVVLKLDRDVVGVIVILGLLQQKEGLDWADFELLRFLETYGAAAVQLQNLQKKTGKP